MTAVSAHLGKRLGLVIQPFRSIPPCHTTVQVDPDQPSSRSGRSRPVTPAFKSIRPCHTSVQVDLAQSFNRSGRSGGIPEDLK
ncbi:MAG: hypothetical protein FWD29_09665 [Micrococcales bacterium]|nr:hypothetical protein [Micrococcales bacterium]